MADKIDLEASKNEDGNTLALSINVCDRIEALGGRLGDMSRVSILDLPPGIIIPDPVRHLLAVRWPDPAMTLYSSADAHGPFHWAQNIRFHSGQYADRSDFGFADRGDKELVRFAHARGAYFILFDLNDPDPADPQVYHVASGRYTPTLGSGMRLSAFLEALKPCKVE